MAFNATRFRDDVIQRFHHAAGRGIHHSIHPTPRDAGHGHPTPAGSSTANAFSDSYFIAHRSVGAQGGVDNLVTTPSARAKPLRGGGAAPSHEPPSCCHSYVQWFVDECNRYHVPEDTIVQHVMFMVHAMQDGITMFSELHRKGEDAATLQYDRRLFLLQREEGTGAHRHDDDRRPPTRRSSEPLRASPKKDFSKASVKQKQHVVSRGTQAHPEEETEKHSMGASTLHRGGSDNGMDAATQQDGMDTADASFAVQRLEPALAVAGGGGPTSSQPLGTVARQHADSDNNIRQPHEKRTEGVRPSLSVRSLSDGLNSQARGGRRLGHASGSSSMTNARAHGGSSVRHPVLTRPTTSATSSRQRSKQRPPPAGTTTTTATGHVVIERRESFRECIDRLATPKRSDGNDTRKQSVVHRKGGASLLSHTHRTQEGAERARHRMMVGSHDDITSLSSEIASRETTSDELQNGRERRASGGIVVDGRCFVRGGTTGGRAVGHRHHADPHDMHTPSRAAGAKDGLPFAVDESPLIVPRRRQGGGSAGFSAAAANPPYAGVTDETVQTQTPSTANAAVMACSTTVNDDGRRQHTYVDDATQSEAQVVGRHGSIGAVRLAPPCDSPQFRKYLQDTRDALASVEVTLRRRRPPNGSSRHHGASSVVMAPPPSPPPATVPAAPTAMHDHSSSPLRWQRSGTPYDDSMYHNHPKHRHTAPRDPSEEWGCNVSDLSSEADDHHDPAPPRRARRDYL